MEKVKTTMDSGQRKQKVINTNNDTSIPMKWGATREPFIFSSHSNNDLIFMLAMVL
jgi:hypothetical protein